jgi:hypothetical protein
MLGFRMKFIWFFVFFTIHQSNSMSIQNFEDAQKLKEQLPTELQHCIVQLTIKRDGNCGRLWESKSDPELKVPDDLTVVDRNMFNIPLPKITPSTKCAENQKWNEKRQKCMKISNDK